MEPQKNNDAGSHLFLTGAILCANLDYTGLAEYALKALIGGVIWMGFKMGADVISLRLKKRRIERAQIEKNK